MRRKPPKRCVDCGCEVASQVERCWACHLKRIGSRRQSRQLFIGACPTCGGPKVGWARLCRVCNNKRMAQDPQWRVNQIKAAKVRSEKPEWRESIKRAVATKLANPAYRQKMADQVRRITQGVAWKEAHKKMIASDRWKASRKAMVENPSWIANHTGPNNPMWKGGRKPLILVIRNCRKYRQWRKAILERDNFTCAFCHEHGGRLDVDHYPHSFSKILHGHSIKALEDALRCDALWDTGNGRTLCFHCHNTTKRGNHPLPDTSPETPCGI